MTVYINTTYVDWLEELADPTHPNPNVTEEDAQMMDRVHQRLERKGLALDLANIGDQQLLTRCEATRIFCFCLEVGTKPIEKKTKKTR